MRDDDRLRQSFPNQGRKPWCSLLPRFKPETQAELQQVRADLIADWERAGRPCLTPKLIKNHRRYIMRSYHDRNTH